MDKSIKLYRMKSKVSDVGKNKEGYDILAINKDIKPILKCKLDKLFNRIHYIMSCI